MGVPVPVGALKPQFISSVNLDAPGMEVNTRWREVGLLISKLNETHLLHLYERPIAPLQELYQYRVSDKDGFMIPLDHVKLLEEGDVVNDIPGKPGAWIVKLYQTSKYVWI